MVCPYRLVTGFITAALSIFYVSRTLADADGSTTNQQNKSGVEHKKTKPPMSTARRSLLIAALILFHIDLFTTGYVRMGAKHLWQNSILQMQQG